MYEVEVKVPADLSAVRDRLQAVRAERFHALEQVDTYYGAPDRDFAETDEALRTREERPLNNGDREPNDVVTKLTYKGPKVDAASKTRTEHETAVADPEELHGILVGLGYTPVETVRKERVFYEYDGYTVTLDRVDDVGSFVEVECELDAAGGVEEARDGAFAVLRELGLDPDTQIRRSYLGLLLDDGE